MKFLPICALLVLAPAMRVQAQNIRGVVSERESGAPLPGTFVVLLDSAGLARGGALSDGEGRYFLRAPHAGVFAVRAELIGHETITSPRFAVSPAAPAVRNMSLPVAAVRLDAIRVSGERRCSARRELAQETARVWEEVRKALSVAVWTENTNVARFQARSFERVLDPRTLMLRREAVQAVTSSNRPYAAASADTLARYGFVRRIQGDSLVFYGPDADVLLSDAFLDTHCFWLRHSDREAAGLIGLAFEPVPGRKLRDIRGTLWVDPRTNELKFIDFRYTELGRELDHPSVGGRTDFRRLPTGAWVVDRWYIRLPASRATPRGFVVGQLVESGGEIVSAKLMGAAAEALQKTVVDGIVFDSVRNVPLGNATVYLSGTAHRTVTDSAGRFTIGDVSEGHYMAAFWHPSIDSLPALPEGRALSVIAKVPAQVTLAVPSLRTLIDHACETSSSGGVLSGYVRDKDGNPLPGVPVSASYRQTERGIVLKRESDRSGRFVFCDLPVNAPVIVKSEDGDAVTVRIPSARYARKDVTTAAGMVLHHD